jgi:hypothetical protein
MFRAVHRVHRIHVNDVTGYQPVEQHAERSQVLLDRRRRKLPLQVFNEGDDVKRLDAAKLAFGLRPFG